MAARGSTCGPHHSTVREIFSAQNSHVPTNNNCVRGPSGLLTSPGWLRCARMPELMLLEVVRLLPCRQRRHNIRHLP